MRLYKLFKTLLITTFFSTSITAFENGVQHIESHAIGFEDRADQQNDADLDVILKLEFMYKTTAGNVGDNINSDIIVKITPLGMGAEDDISVVLKQGINPNSVASFRTHTNGGGFDAVPYAGPANVQTASIYPGKENMFGGCGCDSSKFVNTVALNVECIPNVVTLTIDGAAGMFVHPMTASKILALYNNTTATYIDNITSASYVVEFDGNAFPPEKTSWFDAFIPVGQEVNDLDLHQNCSFDNKTGAAVPVNANNCLEKIKTYFSTLNPANAPNVRADVGVTDGWNIAEGNGPSSFNAANATAVNQEGVVNIAAIEALLSEGAVTRNTRTSCDMHNCFVVPDPATCNNNPPPGGAGGAIAAPIVLPSFTLSMGVVADLKYYNVLKDNLGNGSFPPSVTPAGAPAGTSTFYNYLVTGTILSNEDCPVDQEMVNWGTMTSTNEISLQVLNANQEYFGWKFNGDEVLPYPNDYSFFQLDAGVISGLGIEAVQNQLANQTTNINEGCSLQCPTYDYAFTEAQNQAACEAVNHCSWVNLGYNYYSCQGPNTQTTCEDESGNWINNINLDYVPFIMDNSTSFGLPTGLNGPVSVSCYDFNSSNSCEAVSNGGVCSWQSNCSTNYYNEVSCEGDTKCSWNQGAGTCEATPNACEGLDSNSCFYPCNFSSSTCSMGGMCSGGGFIVTDTLNGDDYVGSTYCAYNVVSHLKLSDTGVGISDILSNAASSVSDPTKVTMSYTLGVEQSSGCSSNYDQGSCVAPCSWDGSMCHGCASGFKKDGYGSNCIRYNTGTDLYHWYETESGTIYSPENIFP